MNILLISPKSDSACKSFNVEIPPIGLMYLAGSLVRHGHAVRIADENILAGRDIKFSGYDLVGIGPSTCCYNRAITIARKAKKENKTVVMGGFHATFMDAEVVKTGCVDAVVRGEGEVIFRKLVDAIEQRRSLRNVQGITYADNGIVRRNGGSGIIEDIDHLPYPARELVDHTKYDAFLAGKRCTALSTSRGCVHHCSFCASTGLRARKWRARHPRYVVNEMEEVLKNGWGEGILITDDNFTESPQRVAAICDDISRRGLRFPWWCISRADIVARNRVMVRQMARAGCTTVFLGIESGTEHALACHDKQSKMAIAREATDILANAGISACGSFLLGEENETKDTLRKTLHFSRQLNLELAQFSVLTPFPGSRLYESVRDRIIDTNWDNYDGLHSVFALRHLSRQAVDKMVLRAYAGFYGQPRTVRLLLISVFNRAFSPKVAAGILWGLFKLLTRNIRKI